MGPGRMGPGRPGGRVAGVGVEIEQRHRVALERRRQPGRRGALAQHRKRAAVADQIRQPGIGIGRIERHITASRPPYRQHRHHRVDAARQAQTDHRLGANPQANQPPRQQTGPRPQRAIA